MSIKNKRKITVSLDPQSIQKAIDEVRENRAAVVVANREVAETIGELGVELAIDNLIAHGAVATGQLASSIRYEIEEEDGKCRVHIVADKDIAPYAAYVEFGTGIIGKVSPKHPLHSKVGWQHDVNQHGWEGWRFPKGDHYYPTLGQPARPFLYETVAELEASIPEVVKKVFK